MASGKSGGMGSSRPGGASLFKADQPVVSPDAKGNTSIGSSSRHHKEVGSTASINPSKFKIPSSAPSDPYLLGGRGDGVEKLKPTSGKIKY